MQPTTVCFAPGDEPLYADMYRPTGVGIPPIAIAVHGGGWRGGDRAMYAYLGPFLADRGIAVLSIDYRLVAGERNRYPAALDDVRAAVAYVRANHAALGVDPQRIALMGDSAGAQLAALATLSGGPALGIRAAVCVYGVYDMAAQWMHDAGTRADSITAAFLGAPLTENRRLYHDASPLSYVTTANNATAMFVAWGTLDDIVDPSQATTFVTALKLAGFFVRTATVAAGHYWINDPIDEPESFSGFTARRIARFLQARL